MPRDTPMARLSDENLCALGRAIEKREGYRGGAIIPMS